jgi:hypothetical protein
MKKRLPPTNVELLVSRLSVLACRVKPFPDALQAASALVASDRMLFVTADAGFAKVTGLNVRLVTPSQP